MARATSITAYNTIRDNGMLSRRRWQVYDVLYRHGPLTAGEIHKHIKDAQLNSISPRLAELRDRSVVTEVGQKSCSITGHSAIMWDVTPNLPHDPATQQRRVRWIDDAVDSIYDSHVRGNLTEDVCRKIIQESYKSRNQK